MTKNNIPPKDTSPSDSGETDTSNLRRATHMGAIKIGNATIDCAVLEDGTRVLTQRAFMETVGRTGRPREKTSLDDRPIFLSASNLDPYITDEIREAWTPIPFRPKRGGGMAYGYRAELLAHVCNVYLDAHDAKKLLPNQQSIYDQCRILNRGFSTLGIVALIDEATGYQEERDRDALQRLLEAYIAKELLPWTQRFPKEFYQEIFRLKGWQFTPLLPTKGPRVVGKITNDIVYDRLPSGVLEALRTRNPIVKDGRRQHKHHQFLTDEIGSPHLEKHLVGVIALMRAAATWEQFERMLARSYPRQNTSGKPEQKELPFREDWDE